MASPDDLLVDRDAELALIEQVLAATSDGSSSAVVAVRGAPGTGRSALLRVAAARARQAGRTVLELRCCPTDSVLPWSLPRQAFAGLGLTMRQPAGRSVEDHSRVLAEDLMSANGNSRPVILVDDAHWADAASRRWLRLLVELAAPGLLLGYTEITGLSKLDGDWPVGTAWYQRELAALSPDKAAELVRRSVHPDTDDAAIERALLTTKGNPAVLAEALRRLGGGPIELAALSEVCAGIRRRRCEHLLDGLPAGLLSVLRAVVACVGQATLLAGLIDSPAELWERLEALRGMGLVVGGTISPEVADAVLGRMPAAERVELLRRVAALGEETGVSSRITASLLIRTPSVGQPWAAATLRQAAMEATAADCAEEAVALLHGALREPQSADERAQTLIELAMAELPANPEASDRYLRQVLAAEPGQDTPGHRLLAADLLLARGDGRAATRAIASVFGRVKLSAADRAQLLGLYWLPEGHPEPVEDSQLPLLPPRPADPAQSAAAAIRLATAGSRAFRVRGLARVALAAPVTGRRLLTSSVRAIDALRLSGDLGEASTCMDELVADQRGPGAKVLLGSALAVRARLRLSTGLLDGAADDIGQVYELVPAQGWHTAMRFHLAATEAMIHIELGRIDRAYEALGRAPGRPRTGLAGVFAMYVTALAEQAIGHTEQALAGFTECGRWLSSRGLLNPELLPWQSAVAGCLVGLGEPEAGARLLAEEIALAKEWSPPAAVGGAYLRAAQVLGPGPTATTYLEDAVRLLWRGEARLRLVHALIELATAKLAAGEHAAAGRLVADATGLVEAHGWGHLRPRLLNLADDLDQTVSPSLLGLTKTQRQVAELAVGGVSNAGIAARLAVTKRTVELHLTNVYRKLGIVGREQLRQAMSRQCAER